MSGRIFFLETSNGRVLSANADGSDLKTVVVEGRKIPDGVAVDVAESRLYWTNMGDPNANDGSILSSDLDGSRLIWSIAVDPHRHRNAVRRAPGTDRSGNRSHKSHAVLDGPWRPAAREHGQSRAPRCASGRARSPRNFGLPLDGGHRSGTRSTKATACSSPIWVGQSTVLTSMARTSKQFCTHKAI